MEKKIKDKISDALKKAHKEGRHPGWNHINFNTERRSYPEIFFLEVLNKNGLSKKYKIIEKMPFGKYALDFAIVELKLDVEIDGQQHFRNPEAIKKDKERDDFLISNGWKIYRIAWIEMSNNKKKEIEKFLNFIENIHDESSVFYDVDKIKFKKKKKDPKFIDFEDYHKHRKEEAIKRNKIFVDLILNSGIDFSSFGWVNKVSKLTNIKHQRVKKWMLKYMPDFYNKCYKRSHSLTG